MFCRNIRNTSTRYVSLLALIATLVFQITASTPAHAATVNIDTPIPNDTPVLTVDDVNQILAQGVGYLKANALSGIISVVDREGHILAIYRMTQSATPDIRINEQATAKARTAAFFQSDHNAFTTRTAQFIIQGNFPPGIKNLDSGPLYGVPFSNFNTLNPLDVASQVQLQVPPFIVFAPGLSAKNATDGTPATFAFPAGNTNQRPKLQPLVITPLTDDLGGLPLFKNGKAAGGVGVEIDGFGVVQLGIPDSGVKSSVSGSSKVAFEEAAATAAFKGFEPARKFQASSILINGFRFPFTGKTVGKPGVAIATAALLAEGSFEPYYDTDGSERLPTGGALDLAYKGTYAPLSVTLTGVRATPKQEFPRQGFVPRFPARNSPLGSITVADVRQMIQQAADKALKTRAAIRNPKGEPEQIWVCVTDLAGNICGSFRTEDATPFSFDVHVQKARTAAFFSTDKVGLATRGIGYIAQTFYPSGISRNPAGPISGLLNVDKSIANAGILGLTPTGGTGNLTEISQLLIDTAGPALLETPGVPPPPSVNGKIAAVVQQLAVRMPHVRDQRLSPLQLCLSVDLSLGRTTSAGGQSVVPTQIPNGITIFAGGVPLYKNGLLVGGLGVSGGGIDQDDLIAAAGAIGFEPPPGVACDQASDADILDALKAAVTKLKAQFPNLTNGTTAVLDVIEQRLAKGTSVFQGLRLPYTKYPRSAGR